jgi:hypothetical protein
MYVMSPWVELTWVLCHRQVVLYSNSTQKILFWTLRIRNKTWDTPIHLDSHTNFTGYICCVRRSIVPVCRSIDGPVQNIHSWDKWFDGACPDPTNNITSTTDQCTTWGRSVVRGRLHGRLWLRKCVDRGSTSDVRRKWLLSSDHWELLNVFSLPEIKYCTSWKVSVDILKSMIGCVNSQTTVQEFTDNSTDELVSTVTYYNGAGSLMFTPPPRHPIFTHFHCDFSVELVFMYVF